MIPLIQQLDKINATYLYSTDVNQLQQAFIDLDKLIDNPALFEDKRVAAQALLLRLDAKICLLNYAYNFHQQDYDDATKSIAQNLAIAESQNYVKTVEMLTVTQGFVRKLYDVVNEVDRYAKVLTENGDVVDSQIFGKAMANVAVAKDMLDGFSFDCDIPNLQLPNLKQLALNFLTYAEGQFADAQKHAVAAKLADCALDITHYRDNTYFPLPEKEEGGKSNVLVVSTPLVDDARLFAANACGHAQKLLCVSADNLKDKSADFFQTLFQYASDSGCCLVVEGVDNLTMAESDLLLTSAMFAGKRGVKVFVTDTGGQAQLYRQALDISSRADGLNVTDVSLEYVSLPLFQDVKQLFEEREMATPSSSGALLKQMPFMGFYGLNQVVRAYAERNSGWQEVGKHASAVNKQAVLAYLNRVPQTYLLIDSGWGDFSHYDKQVTDREAQFDYDGVKEVDLFNVRQIVESNQSVFAKCGMIARYCTLGGDDLTAWQRLDRAEMQQRITLAVRLVFKILRIDIVPQVELLDELSNGTAGGLCVDGGKVVQFKYDCAQTLDPWMYGAIVHESFHALQSQLTQGQWRQWYYDNMGISRGRVEQWRQTRQIYDHNTHSRVYKVHMYEADARAFEADCEDGRNKAWNLMNFR